MFSKRRFRRRNKPRSQNFLEGGEQQKETPFIPPIQTKLNIGKPGDVYEVEADNTADKVLNRTESAESVQKMGAEEEEVQAKPLAQSLTSFVQKQEVEKEEKVQKQPAEEEEQVQAQVEEEEEVQAREEEEEEVQAQEEEEEEVQAQEEEEEEVQAREEEKAEEPVLAKTNSSAKNGMGLSSELKAAKGSGSPMDKSTQTQMEQAFGNDFSKVKIHTDAKAIAMNKQLHAQAFTHGNDIYFNNGKYHPDSKKGKHLLAHELTHTIQQGAIGAKPPEGGNFHNTSSTVQKKDKRFGPLTWADYEITAQSGTPHSVISEIPIELKPMDNLVGMGWNSHGENITVTIDYRMSEVEIFAVMKTEKSSKESWITDDEAARQKLGHDNLAQARADILSHEQVHFRNAEVVAQKYNTLAKDQVPKTPYIETFTLASGEGIAKIEQKTTEIAEHKTAELRQILIEIKRKANEELEQIQAIYDQNTDHGRESEQQKSWEDNYNKALEDAMKSKVTEK